MTRNTAILLGSAAISLFAYHQAKKSKSDTVSALVIGSLTGNLLTGAIYDGITK